MVHRGIAIGSVERANQDIVNMLTIWMQEQNTVSNTESRYPFHSANEE